MKKKIVDAILYENVESDTKKHEYLVEEIMLFWVLFCMLIGLLIVVPILIFFVDIRVAVALLVIFGLPVGEIFDAIRIV